MSTSLANGNLPPPPRQNLLWVSRNRPQILFMLRACSNQGDNRVCSWTQLAYASRSPCVATCFWLTGPPSMMSLGLQDTHNCPSNSQLIPVRNRFDFGSNRFEIGCSVRNRFEIGSKSVVRFDFGSISVRIRNRFESGCDF